MGVRLFIHADGEARGFEGFQVHQRPHARPYVVRHAIDPGAQAAPPVERGEAPPEFEVHLLQQIRLAVRMRFIATHQTAQGRAILGVRFVVEIVLALAAVSSSSRGGVHNRFRSI